jgi:hypothetical protein
MLVPNLVSEDEAVGALHDLQVVMTTLRVASRNRRSASVIVLLPGTAALPARG